MGSPDSRSRILAAATPLFARHGLNGVSVRKVASSAGVNVSMISYHFGGKEALYTEILKGQFSVFRHIDEIRKMNIPPVGKFREYIRWIIDRYRKNPHLLRFYASELTNPTPCFNTIVHPAVRKVLKALHETFNRGISEKQFRDGLNPADGVLALAGMINFYFLVAPAAIGFVPNTPERDEELVEHFMDILTKGIVAR